MSLLPSPATAGTVIVGMSGGVDSAVCALLLRDAGYPVQCLFMSNWDSDDAYCTAAQDYQDARAVCDALGLALHRVNFAVEYRERVFAHFLREYAAGRTPNPDVLCNREIKFGVCLEYMRRLGADWIATGHYARLDREAGRVRLRKALDASKDQSYFLHQVPASALERTMFPLGGLRKEQVRRLAHAAGLAVFDKPDSTGICFVGERPFDEFLRQFLEESPGPIQTPEGRVLGEHRGLALYTLGQRSGLRIGGRAGAAAAPWYVAAKDPPRNALIVVQDQDHPLLLSDGFDVADARWLAGAAPRDGDYAVKTRYRQADLPCRIRIAGSGGDAVEVTLPAAARAVTPGQYAVFYAGETCLGGGVIARPRNSHAASRREHAPAGGPAIAYNSFF